MYLKVFYTIYGFYANYWYNIFTLLILHILCCYLFFYGPSQIKKTETVDKEALGGTDVGAIRMIHDPTTFSEKLFASLRTGSHVCLWLKFKPSIFETLYALATPRVNLIKSILPVDCLKLWLGSVY